MCDEGSDACGSRHEKVECDQVKEHHEILVVSVAETVVDVDAVMVKLLNALTAYHAVKSFAGFDHFTVEAKVLQIYVSVIPYLKQVYHVEFLPNVARIHTVTHQVKDD